MPKYTSEVIENAARLYRTGMKMKDVAAATGIPFGSVWYLLEKAGVAMRPIPGKLDPSQIADVVRRYEGGEPMNKLTTEFGVSIPAIHGLLRRRGIKSRPMGPPPLVARPECFAEPESCEEAAYFIGFLMADGCISETPHGRHAVSVGVQLRDREVIDRLNAFVGGHYKVRITRPDPLRPNVQQQAPLFFSHPIVAADLARHGLTPRKSLTAAFPDHLLDNRHVWRGMIDGDGSVGWHTFKGRRYPKLSLVGSPASIRQFVDYVRRICPGFKGTPRPGRFGTYNTCIVGGHASTAAKVLYSNCNIALSRKAKVAAEMMTWVPIKQRQEVLTPAAATLF